MNTFNIIFIVWALLILITTILSLVKLYGRSLVQSFEQLDLGIKISSLINLGYSLGVFATIFFGLQFTPPSLVSIIIQSSGLIVVIVGYFLNYWASKQLTVFYSSSVNPSEGAQLIVSGAFSICRHPIMLSLLMNWIGTAMALNSYILYGTFGFAAILIVKRIAIEEFYLEQRFSEDFRAYKDKVSVLVPFLSPGTREFKDLESAIELLKTKYIGR